MSGYTRAEQETVIRWDEDEQTVSIWSASPKTWRRAKKLGLVLRKETTTQGEVTGRFYSIALDEFRWGKKGNRKGNPQALRPRKPQ